MNAIAPVSSETVIGFAAAFLPGTAGNGEMVAQLERSPALRSATGAVASTS